MLLSMRHITKVYPNGVVANDDMQLDLAEGEILAVVGENGAGKSTIMKILYGLERPTSGEIVIRGETCVFKNPQEAIARGIGMIQQNFMLLPPFTVAENIVYGNEPRKRRFFFDRKRAEREVRELSRAFDLDIDPNAVVKDCPVGIQQRCEILKVLYQNTDIIIFDEPSAVLTPQEVTSLLEMMRNLAKKGKSIILITHKLNEVMDVSDRCVVMRNGKRVATLKTAETNTAELSALMVGRRLVDSDIPAVEPGECVLDVQNLSLIDHMGVHVLSDCSIHVNGGEIVGIAGVSGNGQTELLHALVGLMPAASGKIYMNGKDTTSLSVREIREAGCAYVPEDRNTMGAAAGATLTENLLIAHQREKDVSRHGLLKYDAANKRFDKLLRHFDVRFSSVTQKAGELSGGNLQKLIVAREMNHHAPLQLISEPTRGVDIGAMEFIHNQLISQRSKGTAILLVSSDLTELLKLSDRIYVMYGGRVNREFTREEATSEAVGLRMMGGGADE